MATANTNVLIPNLHPIFDPVGYYRAASQESIWHDGGADSVRRFFTALYRHSLLEEWGDVHPPRQPQPWGFDPVVDAALHRALQHSRQAPRPEPVLPGQGDQALVGAHRAAAGGVDLKPGLMTIRLHPWVDAPTALPEVDITRGGQLLPDAFSRASQQPGILYDDQFEVRLRRDDLKLTDADLAQAPPWCVALLLTSERLDALAALLNRPSPAQKTLKEAGEVVEQTLAHLAARPSDRRSLALAARLAGVLALAPGFEGVCDANHEFRAGTRLKTLPEGRKYPSLPLGSFVLACVGPPAV